MTTTDIVLGSRGELEIPADRRERFGLAPGACMRAVETPRGILLVPLTEEPLPHDLADGLSDWQDLGLASWVLFPFEGDTV